ncbi:hypothetical protein [Jiulongibacter sp. NS-SX5]|uniref:hypothetical protein n=1 Tax=Jiulongibacter sp. NS-SX5 TaxID=3463854 RepID=UPI00405A447F
MEKSGFRIYADYFKDFVENDEDLKFFLFGGVHMGMAHANGHRDFKYPFLWLEEPMVPSSNNGGQYWDEWQGGVSLITEHRAKNSIDKHIEALDLAFQLIQRLEMKMRVDYEDDFFLELDDDMKKGIIDPIFLKDAVGWRLEFSFKLNSNEALHDN